MLLVVAYVFIITGFLIFSRSKKSKKNSSDLFVAKVVAVKEDSAMNELTVSFSMDDGQSYIDEIIRTRKRINKDAEVIIKIKDGEVLLYQGEKLPLLIASLCWLFGILFCVLAH